MTLAISLDQMTANEKLQLMEELWGNLSRQPQGIPSPEWHGEILESREAQVKNGTMAFEDWSEVKTRLFNELK